LCNGGEEQPVRHPRERSRYGSRIDRRDFLRRSAATTAGFSGVAALLAACGGDDGGAASSAVKKIATPDDPATLPLYDDNAPIESGLEPEAGPLRLYNWDEYIWPKVLKDFSEKFDVDFELTTFYNMAEAKNKIRTGQADFDIFFPTPDVTPQLVQAKFVQPLNHDYLPNLSAHVWPELTDPWYDQGSRYTVPYVVYTTGIAWRKDMVDEDIGARDNPYEVFWDPQYAGKIGIYDDYREAMSMVMLKNGIENINTRDPKVIDMVQKELIEMADAVNIRTTIDGAYSGVPEGKFAVHQSWSGDIVAGPYYMPGDDYGDPNGLLQYWWEPNGVIGSDQITILKSARNPVLAHEFLNFMLEPKYAMKNFSWVGYQPPQNTAQPASLVKDGYVVPNLKPAIVEKQNFDTGVTYTNLPPEVDQTYQDAWASFKSGV
jgi:spermidine/putrescine transport system substrate-binding protein